MNPFDSLLGEAPEFQAVVRSAQVVAATDATVLVLGESGTGKELLAEALHRTSRRATAPFVTINCAALPEALAESELFGHAKGAFTGAIAHSMGRIGAAQGGTLFLDEIAELPLALQAKLLRFLESGEIQAVGETTARRVDVRVIAATHRDLYTEVKAGRFRADLFYRLNVIPLELPPLRNRTGDLPLLMGALTARLAAHHGLAAPEFRPEALSLLQAYQWPGNVRELRNFCERMVVLLSGRTIGPENLPAEIRLGASGEARQPRNGMHLFDVEQQMLREALDQTGGNRSQAARLLGISRDTFLYRLKKYAIS